MMPRRRGTARTLTAGVLFLAFSLLSHPTAAQVVAVKTMPIADGEQFSFFPAANLGMGDVSIAIRDSLYDLFVNPAKGAALGGGSYFFGSPSFFSVSARAGSGSTFPAGVVARSGSSFAAAALAIQTLTDGEFGLRPGGFRLTLDQTGPDAARDSHTNRYGFVLLGRSFTAARLSVAASALWSTLGAIDGVNLLYSSSRSVSQSGGSADLRLGILKEWDRGHSLETLLLRRRVDMRNDVTYVDLYWDPVQRLTIERPRLEHDGERTNTWGIHFAYRRPLADSGWRVGAVVTANRLAHPRTAAYEIASFPSDRGRSSAFNFGLGVARIQRGATLALDAIYEPIWSRQWALADSATTTAGSTIQVGSTAIDNRLRFSNALLRVGLSQDISFDDRASMLRLQLGLQARSIYYSVDQHDLLRGSTRKGGDDWMEWTRSWGWALRRPGIEVRYAGRLTSGTGRPGVAVSSQVLPPRPGLGIPELPPPAQSIVLNKVRVTLHQLSVSLPMR